MGISWVWSQIDRQPTAIAGTRMTTRELRWACWVPSIGEEWCRLVIRPCIGGCRAMYDDQYSCAQRLQLTDDQGRAPPDPLLVDGVVTQKRAGHYLKIGLHEPHFQVP